MADELGPELAGQTPANQGPESVSDPVDNKPANQGPELTGNTDNKTVDQVNQSKGDTYIEFLNKQQKELNDRTNQYEKEYSETKARIDRLLQTDLNQPTPQPPQYLQYPTGPVPGSPEWQAQQAKQNSFGNMLGQIIALIGIGSVVFGKHRNPWANATLMSGIGAFMTGLSQGKQQQAKDALEAWSKTAELINEENKQRTQQYKDVMENRHLSLDQQTEAIKMLALKHRDVEMAIAASNKNVLQITKLYQEKQKAIQTYQKGVQNVIGRSLPWLKSAEGMQWSTYVYEKSKGKINPNRSAEELNKAMEMYPPSKMISEFKGLGKEQFSETGESKGKESMESIYSGKDGPTKKDFEDAGFGDQ